MRRIAVLFKKDGSVEIQTDGFHGEACLKEAEELIAKLAQVGVEAKTEGVTRTAEYYAEEKAEVRVTA